MKVASPTQLAKFVQDIQDLKQFQDKSSHNLCCCSVWDGCCAVCYEPFVRLTMLNNSVKLKEHRSHYDSTLVIM